MENIELIQLRNKILDLSRDDNRLTIEDWKEEHGDKCLGDCIDDLLKDFVEELGYEIGLSYREMCDKCNR